MVKISDLSFTLLVNDRNLNHHDVVQIRSHDLEPVIAVSFVIRASDNRRDRSAKCQLSAMAWLHLGSFFLFVLIDSTNSLLASTFSEFGSLGSKTHKFSVSADNLFSAKGSVARAVSASGVSDACFKAATQESVVSKCKYNVFSAFVFACLSSLSIRHFAKQSVMTLPFEERLNARNVSFVIFLR